MRRAVRPLPPRSLLLVVLLAAVAWALVPSGIALAQTAPAADSTAALVAPVRLFAGWNDVLYQGITLPVEQALSGAVASVPVIWEFDAASQRWNVWAAAAPAVAHSLTHLQPGGVYFLQATRATFWLPPLVAPPAPPAEPAESDGGGTTVDEAPADETEAAPVEPGL